MKRVILLAVCVVMVLAAGSTFRAGAGRGSRTPKTRRPADFEFHSGF
jgi:hypothetical protein